MNVNKANRYVSTVETTTKRLNRFYQPHGLHTTFDSGLLVPIYLKEVLPNDVRKLSWSAVTRLLTPLHPTMDNAKLDTFFFYVRNRDIWEHWTNFCGYSPSKWVSSDKYTIPQLHIPLGGTRKVGDLADYMGIPISNLYSASVSVNALPFRAVAKVWNDYFRDENYQDESYFPLDETVLNYSTAGTYVDGIATGRVVPPVNRYKDYFSSCLPAPQKGQPVELPLGDYAPIVVDDSNDSVPGVPLFGAYTGGQDMSQEAVAPYFQYSGTGESANYRRELRRLSSNQAGDNSQSGPFTVKIRTDLKNATATTVNALRIAFQTQRFLELSARGGTRYVELLQSMFGVNSPDLMLNRAEFLGGKSFPISLTPVTDVSSNGLGNVGGMSNTVSGDFAFKKHFTEHGFIIGFACVRTDRSYGQGIEPLWTRKALTDFYFPVFSHIGEQPVYSRELLATGTAADDNVFGYKEAWSEYRISFSKATSLMRPGGQNSLSAWTYTDSYSAPPVLNSDWLTHQKQIIDRTIKNTNEQQFLADFYFDDTLYSVVSKNSAPGLIDHY